MTSILVASHGHMASGIQSSIDILTGRGDEIKTIDAYVDQHDYIPEIKEFIAKSSKPCVIFTDLEGGSVNQKVVIEAAERENVFIVTQANLAVVLSVLLDGEKLTSEHLDELIKESQVKRVQIQESDDESDDDFFS
ncbi:PTS sugar transporter subunit IIA [Xylocopilactobacillus apis]|uniref:PTS mannose transporter subunit IIA n=1 Tax=Xylocopilactobacillus apis TaxID=2932183 RepID=A0AAU9CZZ8_9LACO|nr:PTS fructose transporter subunit IIA [Xylocopilactobacillus apis]BDR56964.1 PTS mannose transporter subunit IIA [Xylocopilactobacillus apis]